ncbi:hypothetical protein KXS15_23140 [Sinorhizobium meliloti]|uniref:MT-A70 family methyltransferase n=1 Tax=Rhizobium meliloti TaxID=382 RepID=UPI003F160BC9
MTDWFFDPLLPLHYEMIVIDCPWDHEAYSEKGLGKSQHAHYDTMSDDEIYSLPVGQLASMNSLLLAWSTAPRLDRALEAVQRWGFQYKSYLVWRKTTRTGKVRMGPGYRVRTTGEIVIVATLGNPKQAFAPPTIFDGIARESGMHLGGIGKGIPFSAQIRFTIQAGEGGRPLWRDLFRMIFGNALSMR